MTDSEGCGRCDETMPMPGGHWGHGGPGEQESHLGPVRSEAWRALPTRPPVLTFRDVWFSWAR